MLFSWSWEGKEARKRREGDFCKNYPSRTHPENVIRNLLIEVVLSIGVLIRHAGCLMLL
jgi:hypothetical protein